MTTESKKPRPLTFTEAAESYLSHQLADWVACVRASGLEDAALAYARQESWVMPNEGLEAVTALNLFPGADIASFGMAVKNHPATEVWAKRGIAAAVQDGIREANAGIARLKASQEAKPAIQGTGGQKEGTDAAPVPVIASQGPALGVPEGLGHVQIWVWRFKVGESEFYTTDKAINEYVKAAQVQAKSVAVEWVAGEHGNRAVGVRVCDVPPNDGTQRPGDAEATNTTRATPPGSLE